MRIGLLGFGAIGSVVARALVERTHGLARSAAVLDAVLVRTARDARPPLLAGHDDEAILFTTDADAFFARPFDVLVECAGQQSVRAFGERALQTRSLLVTSIGVFTDDAFYQKLGDVAAAANTKLYLASGAMPALDWAGASALQQFVAGAAADTVTVVQTKPPASWAGARFDPATGAQLPDEHDYAALQAPVDVFAGTARDAAACFPKNSNVCAMLALTTAGLDDTRVRLVADPTSAKMRLRVEYAGAAGALSVEVEGKKSPANPRTSMVVPLSVVKAIRNLSSPVVLGV